MSKAIKVIDLFAGPGGLGEGFSAYQSKKKNVFKIAISIEKEESAHRTLLLRALFRQFAHKDVPEAYYEFLRGNLGKNPEDELYKLPEIQVPLAAARKEAQQLTLGEDNQLKIYGKIRDILGKDECILIGGPPCQAYSIAGASRKEGYNAEDDHRNFLYLEYLKVIAKFQPKVFVMENVKGILSAKINGQLIFNSIIEDLQDPYKTTRITPDSGRSKHQYKIFSFVPNTGELNVVKSTKEIVDPHDFVIRTESYGIPQTRHRVILLGIRSDIASTLTDFKRLKFENKQPTVKQVLSDLPKLRSRLSKGVDTTENWREAVGNLSRRSLQLLSKDKLVPKSVYKNFLNRLENITNSSESIGADKGVSKKSIGYNRYLPKKLKIWYEDKRLGKYVVNHNTRGHIEADLHRYLYYSTYAEEIGVSPTSKNLPKVLWPAHKNFSSGKFTDRFRVQISKKAGTTITCHISKDGHYFIHYDPSQCRSLTVREAARIQTFPDNYYFVGTRTQQYVQVGNAVPPYLAYQLAKIVNNIIN